MENRADILDLSPIFQSIYCSSFYKVVVFSHYAAGSGDARDWMYHASHA